MNYRATILSLFTSAATAWGAVSDGSYVTGTIADVVGSSTTVKVTFTPMTAPLTFNGSWVVSGRPKDYTATNGALSLWLNGGKYVLSIGGSEKLKIDVPTGGGTNDIGSIASSGIVWVTPGSGGGGTNGGTSYSTSAQLAADIVDETGTGPLVLSGSPVLGTPQIADFSSATHDHQSAAKGGSLNAAAIASGTLPMSRGGTGVSLTDPNANRVLGWDDTEGYLRWWTFGAGFTMDDVTDTITFTAAGTGDVLAGNTMTNGMPLLGASGKTIVATNAAGYRAAIGLAVGSDVQAYDADLGSVAGGITGLVKGAGNGNGYSAAVAGSDYLNTSSSLNGDNISSGTVADARIASTIARDSEVAALTPYGTNQWTFWQTGTNSYAARQGNSWSTVTSNDFSGLLQYAYENSGSGQVYFEILPSDPFNGHYRFSKTVNLTNNSKLFTVEGRGNAPTVLVPQTTFTAGDPMFRVGSTNHSMISSLCVFRNLRFDCLQSGFGDAHTNQVTGVLVENGHEPVFDGVEFSTFRKGIAISAPSVMWGYADRCWFVTQINANSVGVELSGDRGSYNDFSIQNCEFWLAGGKGVWINGNRDNNLIVGNRFYNSQGVSSAIKVTGGTNTIISGNSFVKFTTGRNPIYFDARASSEDVQALVIGNTLQGGAESLFTVGANVTGVNSFGNHGNALSMAGTVSDFKGGSITNAAIDGSQISSGTVGATYIDSTIARDSEVTAAITAATNWSGINVGTLALTNPVGVASGGTARSTITAGSLLSGNGTGTPDLVTIGSGLSLSGSAGDGTRTLTASASGGTNFAALTVNPSAYGAGWNGSTNVPTRDDVYDKIESMGTAGFTNMTETNYTVTARNLTVSTNLSVSGGTNGSIRFNDGNATEANSKSVVFQAPVAIQTNYVTTFASNAIPGIVDRRSTSATNLAEVPITYGAADAGATLRIHPVTGLPFWQSPASSEWFEWYPFQSVMLPTVSASGGSAANGSVITSTNTASRYLYIDASTAGSRSSDVGTAESGIFGSGLSVDDFWIRTPAAVSSASDAYTLRIGYGDNAGAAGEHTDGAYFRYTHSENSGNWTAVTRSNTSETATDTGVSAAANTVFKLRVHANADGSAVVFSINGNPAATNTANIPTGTSRTFRILSQQIERTGTAATIRSLHIYYIRHYREITGGR